MVRVTIAIEILTTILIIFPSNVETSRILIVSLQQKSHMIYMHAAGAALLERGHEVYTVMGSHFPEPKDLLQLGFQVVRFDVPKDAITIVSPQIQEQMTDKFMYGKPSSKAKISVPMLAAIDCELMLDNPTFMQRLGRINFDIAIIDGFPLIPCGFLVPHVLGIPYIFMSSGLFPELTRVPALPSFVPSLLTPFNDKMSFFQRIKNLFMTIMTESGLPVIDMLKMMTNYTLVKKYSQDPTIQTWTDLMRKSELFLITRGPSLEYPMPMMPNIIQLEGISATPAKALPSGGELLQFVQASTKIIVVSFGSVFGSFPDEITKKFLDAFRQREESFIWRVIGKNSKHMNLPPNVKLMSWLPQNDLLGHPKTRLFITHCGNNGQNEALYHGVPMIGFPIFGEQPHNAARLVSHGFGLSGDLKQITSQELVRKIDEVMTNSMYYDNIKKASQILHSFPQSARNLTTYWTEHVIKFGSQHLRSYALDMPLYQYLMVDIALFMGTIIAIVLFCAKYTFRFAYKCLIQEKRKDKMN